MGENKIASVRPSPLASIVGIAGRLRKLEALRRDKLIDEEEYKNKRKKILDEKW